MISEFSVFSIPMHPDLTVNVTSGRLLTNHSQNRECVTGAFGKSTGNHNQYKVSHLESQFSAHRQGHVNNISTEKFFETNEPYKHNTICESF